MRKIAYLAIAALLLWCGLVACGIVPRSEASAPMAQNHGQVRTTLTPLPEDLHSVTLRARTSSIVLQALSDGIESTYEYRPATGAYRRLVVPMEGDWTVGAMTASPDGCLWSVLYSEEGCVLIKSSQGSVLLQCDLMDFIPDTLVCDNVGHVFAATADEVRRYSPEGELQGSLNIQDLGDEVRLAAQQQRVFLRARTSNGKGVYWELSADMTLGSSFDACVSDRDAWPIGSFLEGYCIMEADSTGLYAYREDFGWETVCLWSEQNLDGTVDSHLISDAQGCGAVQYEKNRRTYCLNLAPSQKNT